MLIQFKLKLNMHQLYRIKDSNTKMVIIVLIIIILKDTFIHRKIFECLTKKKISP